MPSVASPPAASSPGASSTWKTRAARPRRPAASVPASGWSPLSKTTAPRGWSTRKTGTGTRRYPSSPARNPAVGPVSQPQVIAKRRTDIAPAPTTPAAVLAKTRAYLLAECAASAREEIERLIVRPRAPRTLNGRDATWVELAADQLGMHRLALGLGGEPVWRFGPLFQRCPIVQHARERAQPPPRIGRDDD